MSQKILIDCSRESISKFALISENGLEDFELESSAKKNLKGNIYLGKVSRIEASLQAAFVDIGSEKNGFLAFGEIHPNYFQIPVADREALIEAEAQVEEDFNEEKEAETQDDKKDTNVDVNEAGTVIDDSEDSFKQKNKKRQSSILKRKLYRSYKIQEVIKAGQLILVQVVKEERGNKGAALTSYISLAGKYSVLMPNSTKTKGISRKISTSDDRSKLKKIIDDLKVPSEMGLIIRTAGLNKTKNEIKKDYSILKKLWVQIVNETKKAIAPALIHEEGNLLRRVVRDVFTTEMKEILVEGKDAYQETKKYMTQVLPSCSKYVKQFKNKESIFSKYDIEKDIIKMFEPEVKLKSGGYLVINPTEALVAIDVNSGGATKERNIEKTALKTNLEAAEEIARQIKLRDLSGLIVIDFIDMYEMRNNRQVEKKMKELIRKDRARTQITRISQFGLLEMSRQRLRQSFIEWNTVLSNDSLLQKHIYKIKEAIKNRKQKTLTVKVNPYININLMNYYSNEIEIIEKTKKTKIKIVNDDILDNSSIEFDNTSPKKAEKEKPKKKNAQKSNKNVKKKSNVRKKKSLDKKVETNATVSPIKEIKNKKTGWWQK